jgi:periplasmic protein CpxP/Spy
MKINAPTRLASFAMAALLFVSAALAQPQQPAATQGATTQPPAATSSPMAGHAVPGKNAKERVERRIKELHSQLQITPAEEPQWNEFASVMRENARDMDQAFMQRTQQFATMNAVQNMQSYEQLAEAHAQNVQKLVPAFQKLYDAMPDQQKRLADQVFRANAERHISSTRCNRVAVRHISDGGWPRPRSSKPVDFIEA